MRPMLWGVVALAACERADPPPAVHLQLPVESELTSLSLRSTTNVEKPPPAPPPPAPPPGSGWFRGLSGARARAAAYICRERASDGCMAMPGRVGIRVVEDDKLQAALDQFDPSETNRLEHHCRQVYGRLPGCNTPLVVVFDGGAVPLAPAGAARFAFHPGAPVASAWPTAATPWIALDRDGDGAIGAGDELFGDSTRLADGATAHDGFAALAALDANHDGVIDARDPAFASLLLWSDRNGDHVSSPDELAPLSSIVVAIPLANDGLRSALTWRAPDGTKHTGAVVDLYLSE
jgi:hypothetical protein